SFSARNVLGDIKQAARDFIGQLRPQDRAMIVSFDWQVNTLSPLTGDRKALDRAIGKAHEGEHLGTQLHAAMDEGLRGRRESSKVRKAIPRLPDGKDAGSHIGPQPLLETATQADTMIYSVFYSSVPRMRDGQRLPRTGQSADDFGPALERQE